MEDKESEGKEAGHEDLEDMLRELKCKTPEFVAKIIITLFEMSINKERLRFTQKMLKEEYTQRWGKDPPELDDSTWDLRWSSKWSQVKDFLIRNGVIKQDATNRQMFIFYPVIGWNNLRRRYEDRKKEMIESVQRFIEGLGAICIPFLTRLDGPSCPGPDTIQERHKKTAELIRDNFTSSLIIYTGSFKWFRDIKDAIMEKVKEVKEKSSDGTMEILIIRREEEEGDTFSEWEDLCNKLRTEYEVDIRDIKVRESKELKIMSLRFTIIDNRTGILVVYEHGAQTQGKQESEIRQEAYKIDHPDLAKLFAEFARSFADKINARAKSSSPAF